MATIKIGTTSLTVEDTSLPAIIRVLAEVESKAESDKYREWWLDERRTVKEMMEEIQKLKDTVEASKAQRQATE